MTSTSMDNNLPDPPPRDDDQGGRLGWVIGERRVRTLLAPKLPSEGRLLLDGSRQAIPVEIHGIAGGAAGPGGATEMLAVRPLSDEALVSPWATGGSAALWLQEERGLLAFRVPCLGASSGALILSYPAAILRHTRRAEIRYLVPDAPGMPIGCTVQLGTEWIDVRLINVSHSGVQVEVAAELPLPVSTQLPMTLQLGSPRAMELRAEVRHRAPPSGKNVRLGLQFVAPTRLEALHLERFLDRFAPKAAPERNTLQSLPPLVVEGLHGPHMTAMTPGPNPERMPRLVLLTPLRPRPKGQDKPAQQ